MKQLPAEYYATITRHDTGHNLGTLQRLLSGDLAVEVTYYNGWVDFEYIRKIFEHSLSRYSICQWP